MIFIRVFKFDLFPQLFDGDYYAFDRRNVREITSLSGVYLDTTGLTFRSTGNVMTVFFTTDNTHQKKGFTAEYTQGESSSFY